MTAVAPADAATVAVAEATSPSASASAFAFQRPGGTGYLRRADGTFGLPGRDPALGAGLVGWRDAQSTILLATTDSLTPVASYAAPGAGPFAFSDRYVVWLVGGNQLFAQPRDSSAAPREVARARAGEQLGRPSIVGATVVYHRAGTSGSQIRLLDLAAARDTLLRSEHRALLSNPTFDGRRVLYVRSTYKSQELRLGPLTRRATTKDQRLYATWPTARRDPGREKGHQRHRAGYKNHKPPKLWRRPPAGITDTLWTTALGPTTAYVTRIRKRTGAATTSTIISVPR
jgi:hypothetical protein